VIDDDNRSLPAPMLAWEKLRQGNQRFLSGQPRHPGQDGTKRAELSTGQNPFALIFGCSDSRVAAEIIFDQGLGDLFVVRTAGHVVDSSVLGSVEFGVAVLHIPLIVVLGHDSCGAVAATVDALGTGDVPPGFLRDIVERVTPSVLAARRATAPEPPTLDQIEAEHVRQTAALLSVRSPVVSAAVRVSRCAVIGATYQLQEGEVRLAASALRPA
jgi:carbonic anhydrase